MNKIICAVLVCAAFTAAAEAQVNFDQGVNTTRFSAQAVSADLSVPKPLYGIGRYTRDCARFSFGPSEAELVSEKVRLQSIEYIQECQTHYVQQCHTVYHPGPNNTQIPSQQCHMVPVQQCYERPGMSWRQTGQIKMAARKLLPWERESFDVCLEGPWMHLFVNDAAYKYSVKREGNYDALYELAPLNKIPMKADEKGLNFSALTYDAAAKAYKFEVSDRWAAEYAGDKVTIDISLYKDNPNWFDGYRGSREFTLDAAAGYAMTFTEKDLSTEKVVAEEDTKGAKKYYLQWGFKRVGAVSKDNHMKKDETPRVEVK